MERRAVRVIVGGVEVDVPFGAFAIGDTMMFDGTQFLGSSYYASPATILGALYQTDIDAADSGVVLAAGKVASVPNRGLDGAAAVQATAGFRPTYGATAFNGGPGMTFDGTDDALGVTFATPIPVGRRPYMWAVFGNVTNAQSLVSLESATTVCILYMSTGTRIYESPGTGALTGTLPAGSLHMYEGGFSTPALVTDGGNPTIGIAGGASVAIANLFLAAYQGTSQFGGLTIRRVIVASDEPSAAQKTAMRAYFRAQPYGLTIV
jgi:hypothetical protein